VTEWDTLIGDWWFEEMEELQEGDRERRGSVASDRDFHVYIDPRAHSTAVSSRPRHACYSPASARLRVICNAQGSCEERLTKRSRDVESGD
jgi:hypothetical protein